MNGLGHPGISALFPFTSSHPGKDVCELLTLPTRSLPGPSLTDSSSPSPYNASRGKAMQVIF